MNKIAEGLKKWLFFKDDFIKEYKAYSNILGRDIMFFENGIKRYGKAVDIDENGSLIVSVSDGEDYKNIVLNSGEISLRVVP